MLFKNKISFKYIVPILMTGLLSASCSPKQFQSQLNSSSLTDLNNSAGLISPGPPSVPVNYKFEPLAWESAVKGSNVWSNIVYTVIQSEEPQMLGQNTADDVEIFCPKYRSLNDNQRLNFWGQLIAGMVAKESSFIMNSHYVETTFNEPDPVTGRQVASEGLLQLSYQDEKNYNLDCGFDWAVDKKYSDKDVRKSIFNPAKNLRCGIKILARQLTKQRAISTSTGVYWAVLKKDGKFTKVPEIAAITKKLSFCK